MRSCLPLFTLQSLKVVSWLYQPSQTRGEGTKTPLLNRKSAKNLQSFGPPLVDQGCVGRHEWIMKWRNKGVDFGKVSISTKHFCWSLYSVFFQAELSFLSPQSRNVPFCSLQSLWPYPPNCTLVICGGSLMPHNAHHSSLFSLVPMPLLCCTWVSPLLWIGHHFSKACV